MKKLLMLVGILFLFYPMSGCRFHQLDRVSAADTTMMTLDSVETLEIDLVNADIDVEVLPNCSSLKCMVVKEVYGSTLADAQNNLKKVKTVVDVNNGKLRIHERHHTKGLRTKLKVKIAAPPDLKTVALSATNGRMWVIGRFDSVDLNLVNGEVNVNGQMGTMKLELVNGKVNLDGSFDRVNVELVNGSVQGVLGNLMHGKIGNVNGSIDLTLIDINDLKVVASGKFIKRIHLEGFDDVRTDDGRVVGLIGSGVAGKLTLLTVTGKINVSVEKHIYALK